MTGDVFFQVKKGEKFTVKHKDGQTQVLGTRFEISDYKNGFSVLCFEGKVGVTTETLDEKLTAGKGLQVLDGKVSRFKIPKSEPDWIKKKEIVFENVDLKEVIETIERNYGVKIENMVTKEKRYSGSVVLDNLDFALEMVCVPLNISYKKEKERVILQEK
jgi:ferric-dicitrate binding protein FerR (iron transport regulator)